MNSVIATLAATRWADSPVARLHFECGLMAGRLAELLRERFSGNEAPVAAALQFLDHRYSEVAESHPLSNWSGSLLDRRNENQFHPVDLLGYGFNLSSLEMDLLILAGLAEEHEGFADIFRTLHPTAIPRPTLGLAAQLLYGEEGRSAMSKAVGMGAAAARGVIDIVGDGPFHTRHLQLAEALWPVLHGVDAWPRSLKTVKTPIARQGLAAWLEEPDVALARQALANMSTCTVVLSADMEETAFERGAALAAAAEVLPIRVKWPADAEENLDRLLQVHTVARGGVAVVQLPYKDGPQSAPPSLLELCPGPVLFCVRNGGAPLSEGRPLISLNIEHLGVAALRQMWREVIPELGDHAASLAARFPLEPARALQVAEDIHFRIREQGGEATPERVAESIRARAETTLGGGVQLIRPVSGWDQLVLPETQMAQLREAVNRLYLQSQVLDDWRFLEGRRGARGVRLLFAGPSGTGKTLSAEVLAKELNMDLLLVDLSRVISKWIGETEKNLAEVFEIAERARAVLFFDEADSLFGKRTEVSDAHDRYANIETAYLLSRLERYDGMAILATNLRQNIDTAFTRRLEFIVEYEEPAYEQRLALWRCHLPQGAPLSADVRLETLASHYPIVGGLIRNAAVAAAFLAAAQGGAITQHHFIQAIRREYDKAGKAYRELNGR